MLRILITGSRGFIGKNLVQHLAPHEDIEIVTYDREHVETDLLSRMSGVDFVFHLAGVNRPRDPHEFRKGNTILTQCLCNALRQEMQSSGRKIPVLFTSSRQAELENPYGESKRSAEKLIKELGAETNSPIYLFRLTNVFGKWCRPNYNSAVATFCYNIARGRPFVINDPSAVLRLVYIDDVIAAFLKTLASDTPLPCDANGFLPVEPEYTSTVGEVVDHIRAFRESRGTLITEKVGQGLLRALHSTYLSYLPKNEFSYTLPKHEDNRGAFVEMLKTPECGQFSYFTAFPGITRGGHYHHTKTEKFLVIKGTARFRFRQIDSGETHELVTSGSCAEVVETVPGWSHDITNIGEGEMVVMLWANEVFDHQNPDTFSSPL